MVDHLACVADTLCQTVELRPGDSVVDIGSNDGTLLSFYPKNLALVGFDPSAAKFMNYYRPDSVAIPDFFSADTWRAKFGNTKARIITSIAMLYDLEHPLEFALDVASILADDGVWSFEQSYLVSMLNTTAYDTICHEHVEYYGLRQIKWLMDRAGLRIVDVVLTPTNGGSCWVTVCKDSNGRRATNARVDNLLAAEMSLALDTAAPYVNFRQRIWKHREDLLRAIERIHREQVLVLGYGASTKGNVLLQFCGIGPRDLPAIAEVNEDKFGCVTPGTWIPIVAEADARGLQPAYFLVLPWHFEANIVKREELFLRTGGKLLFPLPEVRTIPE
jgi:hypothetical protein